MENVIKNDTKRFFKTEIVESFFLFDKDPKPLKKVNKYFSLPFATFQIGNFPRMDFHFTRCFLLIFLLFVFCSVFSPTF